MIVTRITELDRKRNKIYIDGQFAFVLYKGELRQYHIAEGRELTAADYQEIMCTLLPKRAKLRAMNLLKSREYTEKKLRDKLAESCYPAEVVDEAIAYVKSFHYIDDERYAGQYIEYQLDFRSKRRIENDLLEKGVDKDIICNIFSRLEEDGIQPDETSMIEKLLRKRHFDKENATIQEKQKTYAFLARKGFSHENIQKAVL